MKSKASPRFAHVAGKRPRAFCRPASQSISHSDLLLLLSYNSETGQFHWRQGKRAGTLAGKRNKQGYLTIYHGRVLYAAHRLAWFYSHATWPDTIDHINWVKHDNRLCNLRSCTLAENLARPEPDPYGIKAAIRAGRRALRALPLIQQGDLA